MSLTISFSCINNLIHLFGDTIYRLACKDFIILVFPYYIEHTNKSRHNASDPPLCFLKIPDEEIKFKPG